MKRIKNLLLLPASVALIIASCTSTPTSSSVTETSGNWITRAEPSGPTRSNGVSFVINNVAYVGTGYDNNAFQSANNPWYYQNGRWADLYKFDATGNNGLGVWSQCAFMQDAVANVNASPRNGAAAFAVGGKGYVVGGFDGNNRLKDNWQYDPTLNTWAVKASLPDSTVPGYTARYDAVAFAIGNLGYIACGYTGFGASNDVWAYDPSADKWTATAQLPGSSRTGAVAFVHSNKAYVVTGKNSSGTYVNDFFVFDPSQAGGTWTKLRSIANLSTDNYDDDYSDIVRSSAVSFVVRDTAYLTTGENGGYIKKTWGYDIKKDTWFRKTAFERASRTGAVAFTVYDRPFVGFGNSSGLYLKDCEEFQPYVDFNAND